MQTQTSQRDRVICFATGLLFAASYAAAAAALKSLVFLPLLSIASIASLGVARRRYR